MAKQGSRMQRLADRMLGVPVQSRDGRGGKRTAKLTRGQRYVLERGAESAWVFLTSRDPDTDRPLVWTKDEADKAAPLKPFPAHLEYVRELYKVIENEELWLVDKARQMYITTCVMLYCHWEALYRTARKTILSKSTEKEAKDILRDKVRFPHSQLPDWARLALPITLRPQRMIMYPNTGSMILGVAQNVADTEARGNSATRVLIDEAARQEQFADIVAASTPMAAQVGAMTTPDIGTPGAIAFKKYLDDFEEERREEA